MGGKHLTKFLSQRLEADIQQEGSTLRGGLAPCWYFRRGANSEVSGGTPHGVMLFRESHVDEKNFPPRTGGGLNYLALHGKGSRR